MAKSENNLNAVFTDTANAIRNKTKSNETITPRDFADQISSIPAGVTPSGTRYIYYDGEYNISNYANVDVRVADRAVKDWDLMGHLSFYHTNDSSERDIISIDTVLLSSFGNGGELTDWENDFSNPSYNGVYFSDGALYIALPITHWPLEPDIDYTGIQLDTNKKFIMIKDYETISDELANTPIYVLDAFDNILNPPTVVGDFVEASS